MSLELKHLTLDLAQLEFNLSLLTNETNLSKLIDDQKTYETLALTRCILNDSNLIDDLIKVIFKLRVHETFADLFEYLSTIRQEFNFSNLRPFESNEKINQCYATTNLNERRIFGLFYLDSIINCLMQFSIEYRHYFSRLNSSNKSYLKIFLTCLNDIEFLKNIHAHYLNGIYVISLNWISKVAEDYKHIWNSLNSVESLLKFTQAITNWKITAYGTIANIAFDNDLEKIIEINLIIDKFTNLMSNCINQPDGRLKQQFKDEFTELEEYNVLYKTLNETQEISAITGILFCLYRLSINEKIKLKIFKSANFMTSIRNLIFTGIEVEKQYALQLLSQLAFNNQVNGEINSDQQLIKYVRELVEKNEFSYKKLQKTCVEFLWILQNNTTKTKNAIKGHIMISYNTASRDVCLKIKSELEKLHFKVWIDITDIHGSSLESMAQAVENAEFVLVCVTEKYRQSVNCQAEAQYAFKLNKPIIPCILQSGYHNVNGWLGILIGDKIFVDFTKYEFEESFRRLVKQIDLLSTNTTIVFGVNEPTAVNWTEDQVKNWFLSNNLEQMFETLKPLNGSILFQLYQIQLHTPEFFYKAITKNELIDLKAIAIFSDLIRKLFKNTYN